MKQDNTQPNKTMNNIATSALAWGFPVLLGFIFTPFILKYIGKDAYGIQVLIISVAGYLALLDFGLNGAGTKYLAEFNAQKDIKSIQDLLGTTLTAYTILGFIGALVIWFISPWLCVSVFSVPNLLVNESISAFRIGGLGFFLSMITWWYTAIPTGLQRFDIFNWISIAFGVLNTVGNFLAAYLGYGLIGIIISGIVANIIAIILYAIYTRKILVSVKIRYSFKWYMFKKTMSFGIYMIVFSFFAIIFAQLDKTIIGIMLGTTVLTYYVIPLSVSSINQQVNGKIMQILFPKASEIYALYDIHRLKSLFKRSFNMSVIVGLLISIPLITFSFPILKFWISIDMAMHAHFTMIILVAAFFLAGIIPYSIITGMGFPKYYTYSSIISGVCGLIFYLLLIKPFGAGGAAAAKLISILMTVFFYIYISRKHLDIKAVDLMKIAYPTISIACIIGISFYFISDFISNLFYLFLFSSIADIIFITFVWILGIVNEEEKQKILVFLRIKTVIERITTKIV